MSQPASTVLDYLSELVGGPNHSGKQHYMFGTYCASSSFLPPTNALIRLFQLPRTESPVCEYDRVWYLAMQAKNAGLD